MSKRSERIEPKDISQIGFYEPNLIKAAGKTAKSLLKKNTFNKEEILAILTKVLSNAENYLEDEDLKYLAEKVIAFAQQNISLQAEEQTYQLHKEPLPFQIYGIENIEPSAIKQMQTVMQLPIAIAGALMPDAHQGYGLPIGGVLATPIDKIIPYAVGVDIACRMCLSVFDLPASELDKHTQKYKNLLQKNTLFGTGKGFDKPMQDDLFDKSEWKATKLIKDLRAKAIAQVGTSGTGNHFVEWGILEVDAATEDLRLPVGKYLALLSHSGSRGFGANIAGHYSKLAMENTKLPDFAKHLAWLDMHTEAGQEYWLAMNLAGEYASVNHHQIHKKMAASLEKKPLLMIENHHNFAWKEKLIDGTEVIVHRKGATPANADELGIIPGSMSKPGFVVKGKGNPQAIFSASHGAGRRMSRSAAYKAFTMKDWEKALQEEGIILMGGDLDEAPMAYKDIEQVMAFQEDLVTVLAKFQPKIVRMAEKEPFMQRKKKKNEVDFSES